jgi:hypothetical protein
MKKVLAMLAVPFLLGAPTVQAALTGSLGIAENTCVSPIAKFVGASCSYSGGANIPEDLAAYYAGGWIGPLDAGGFYASAAAAPAFVLSTQTGNEYCAPQPCTGTPLTSFLVGAGGTPGDGKVAPPVDGSGITITGTGAAASIGGTFTIGAGVRQTGTGGALQGSKQVVEGWTSIVHSINSKLVDSASCAGLACTYIIGSDGFPPLLSTAADAFPSEAAADSGQPASASPWVAANGGSGPQTTLYDSANVGIDIVSYGLKGFGARPNVGISTSATISGAFCMDTGLDPVEADTMGAEVIDDVGDCQDSNVAWTSVDKPGNASFDNMVLQITTDDSGAITDITGFYVLEYIIIGDAPNSWVGGVINMSTAVIPVPAAVWLFGSALGLLGWIRRRATV